MVLNFRELELSDKPFIDRILKESDKRFCEYTFGNMYCWGRRYDMKIALTENGFVTGAPDKGRFNFPAGKDSMAIVRAIEQQFETVVFTSLSEQEAKLVCGYEIIETPEKFDYIYETEKLQSLSGKKLAAKRNHINAFLADGEWHTERITKDNIPALLEFNKSWCGGLCADKESSLYSEMCAVQIGLESFEALALVGLVLYKNGKICAYSYGEPINGDTFCVHVEKADIEVRGAYQMINREFARTYGEGYAYFNREDDAGDEGLRRAKLSYYPTEVGKKFKAVKK